MLHRQVLPLDQAHNFMSITCFHFATFLSLPLVFVVDYYGLAYSLLEVREQSLVAKKLDFMSIASTVGLWTRDETHVVVSHKHQRIRYLTTGIDAVDVFLPSESVTS